MLSRTDEEIGFCPPHRQGCSVEQRGRSEVRRGCHCTQTRYHFDPIFLLLLERLDCSRVMTRSQESSVPHAKGYGLVCHMVRKEGQDHLPPSLPKLLSRSSQAAKEEHISIACQKYPVPSAILSQTTSPPKRGAVAPSRRMTTVSLFARNSEPT